MLRTHREFVDQSQQTRPGHRPIGLIRAMASGAEARLDRLQCGAIFLQTRSRLRILGLIGLHEFLECPFGLCLLVVMGVPKSLQAKANAGVARDLDGSQQSAIPSRWHRPTHIQTDRASAKPRGPPTIAPSGARPLPATIRAPDLRRSPPTPLACRGWTPPSGTATAAAHLYFLICAHTAAPSASETPFLAPIDPHRQRPNAGQDLSPRLVAIAHHRAPALTIAESVGCNLPGNVV